MNEQHPRRRGLLLALFCIVLVSCAQLLLKFGVSHLPPLTHLPPLNGEWSNLWDAISMTRSALPVFLGICCYGLSVLCWIAALGSLPLSLAYPLLSLSYPIVYLGAAWLPGLNETLSAQRLAGIALIMAGVVLLMLKANQREPSTNELPD